MRYYVAASVAALVLVMSGCGNQAVKGSEGSRESAAAPASDEARGEQARQAPQSASRPAAKRGPSLPVQLTGRSFNGKEFDPPHIEKGMQLLQHYGSVSTEVKIPQDAKRVHIQLKPRPIDNSYPVVSLLAERIEGGKYARTLILDKEEILNGDETSRPFDIPKGTYKLTLQFFNSNGKSRSHLEIHKISFE